MTDQERREEVAEGELLNDLLDAAESETPAVQPATTVESEQPETTAPSAPEAEAAASAAEEADPAPTAEEEVAASEADLAQANNMDALTQSNEVTAGEATPDSVQKEAGAEEVSKAASAATEGASFTPVAEEAPAATEGASFTPVAEEAPAATEGASFTPVAEEDDRPRRLKDLEVGMELQGRVTSLAEYGIFVDIGVGRDGLVHISEMSDTRIDSPSDLVRINDTVTVRIKSIDLDARRISLTMRSRERSNRGRAKRAEVDREVLGSLKPGDTIEGVITGMAPFGAFADIGVGKDGLVHVSELSEGRVEKPEDAVQVGERYTFKVLEVDPNGTRISLSLRRAQRSQKMQQLEPGQILEGTVSGLAPFGAFVDIGVGRDGLVHISALSDRRVEKVEDVVKPGDKVQVRVLEVDPQSKRISLTMRLEEPAPAETEPASTVIPRTGPASAPRFAGVTAAREEGRREEGRREEGRREEGRRKGGGRGQRQAAAQPQTSETYTTDSDPEEEFEGDATLEDLLSKFGGSSSNRRERDYRRRGSDDEEDDDSRYARRQRDAIRRTLQQVGPEE